MRPLAQTVLPSALLVGLAGLVAATSNAQIIMQYTGDQFVNHDGTLASAHHVEATVKFANVGDTSPTAVDASVVNNLGDVLLRIQSVGLPGGPQWTSTFEWNSGLVAGWYFIVFDPSGDARPHDRISSNGYSSALDLGDQARDEFDYVNPGTYDGYSQVYTPGSWAVVPEPATGGLIAGLGLLVFGAGRRVRG